MFIAIYDPHYKNSLAIPTKGKIVSKLTENFNRGSGQKVQKQFEEVLFIILKRRHFFLIDLIFWFRMFKLNKKALIQLNPGKVSELFLQIVMCLFVLFAILPHQFDNQQEFEGIYESSTTQEGQSATIQKGSFYERVLISINIVFTVLFTIECILKLLAFGLKVWFLLFSLYETPYCNCINLKSLPLYSPNFCAFSCNDYQFSLCKTCCNIQYSVVLRLIISLYLHDSNLQSFEFTKLPKPNILSQTGLFKVSSLNIKAFKIANGFHWLFLTGLYHKIM